VLGTKKAGKNSGELFPRKLQTDGSTSSVKTSKHEKMSENWSWECSIDLGILFMGNTLL